MSNPEISVVSTLYYSEKFLKEFVDKCLDALQEINCSNFELLFVNDGSPDNSLNFLLSLKKQIKEIRIIDLSRNFGHHYAAFAGLSYSRGDYVFLIDCDLEIQPDVLKIFYQEMLNTNYDVVYGVQRKRKGNFIESYFGGLFWKLFNLLSETKIPNNILTERLMSRNYVNQLKNFGDKNLFLAGMMYWNGFNQKEIPLKKTPRTGKTTYGLTKRIRLLIQAITSFSAYPLKLLFSVGLLLTSIAFCYGFYLMIKKILYPGEIIIGYTSLIVVILFSTGLIIASLGIIGIYLEKIFNQVKNRPLFIIRTIYE